MYFLLFGGWSFSLYLLQLIFKNLREICKSYWQYLLGRCELWDPPGESLMELGSNAEAPCAWGAVRFPLILTEPPL